MTLTQTLVIAFLQILAALAYILTLVPLTTFAERKVLGYLQDRLGASAHVLRHGQRPVQLELLGQVSNDQVAAA